MASRASPQACSWGLRDSAVARAAVANQARDSRRLPGRAGRPRSSRPSVRPYAQPRPYRGGLRDGEQRAQTGEVSDQVGQDGGGRLAVVAVPVALGCGLQVGEF